MARPVDEGLRETLLDDVLTAVSRMGLGDLSLRPLARETGVSPHMLLYHFGSRDGLLDAIVAETSRRLASATIDLQAPVADVVRAAWRWMTAKEQPGLLNVFYEVCALGARDPVRRGAVASTMVAEWPDGRSKARRSRLSSSNRNDAVAGWCNVLIRNSLTLGIAFWALATAVLIPFGHRVFGPDNVVPIAAAGTLVIAITFLAVYRLGRGILRRSGAGGTAGGAILGVYACTPGLLLDGAFFAVNGGSYPGLDAVASGAMSATLMLTYAAGMLAAVTAGRSRSG